MALRAPWWTLAGGFAGMAELAQLGVSAAEVQAALERQASASQAGATRCSRHLLVTPTPNPLVSLKSGVLKSQGRGSAS